MVSLLLFHGINHPEAPYYVDGEDGLYYSLFSLTSDTFGKNRKMKEQIKYFWKALAGSLKCIEDISPFVGEDSEMGSEFYFGPNSRIQAVAKAF